MAETMTSFHKISKSKYVSLYNAAKLDTSAIYFCRDTRELYIGYSLVSEPIRFFSTEYKPLYPAYNTLYISTLDSQMWIYTTDGEWVNFNLSFADVNLKYVYEQLNTLNKTIDNLLKINKELTKRIGVLENMANSTITEDIYIIKQDISSLSTKYSELRTDLDEVKETVNNLGEMILNLFFLSN